MQKILNWIKTHLTVILLSFILLYLLWPRDTYSNFTGFGAKRSISLNTVGEMAAPVADSAGYYVGDTGKNYQTPQANRMFVSETGLSLLVKNVRETLDIIENKTLESQGYIVNQNISTPEEGASASISVRVPNQNLKDYLSFLRQQSLKVIYENVSGNDVTDQYYDSEARLEVLNKNKLRLEGILDKAETVEEILRVQNQIFMLQDQIDAIKGRNEGLEARSKTTFVSVSISTDEYSLPYAPVGVWKPNIVFKQAIRSLVSNLSDLGSALIWIGVYAVIWVPAILLIVLIVKFIKKSGKPKPERQLKN